MDVIGDNLGFIADGLLVTVQLTAAAWVGAFAIGVVLAPAASARSGRYAPPPPLT